VKDDARVQPAVATLYSTASLRGYTMVKPRTNYSTFHGSAAHGRVFPTVWTISENWEKEDREKLSPISSLNFRCTKDDKCWLNGKFCRKMSDEEGQKEFPDED
jgi:hypothetical protein